MSDALLLGLWLVVLTAVVSLAVLHWRYRRWPPYVWKRMVDRRIAELSDRRRALHEDTQDVESTTARLADDCFRRHLETIPMEQLAEFSGIGPATLDRLRQAGCRRLADVTAVRVDNVPGIGRTRAKDLGTAVQSLVRAARSRFDAGACPEAQELRRQIAQTRADDQAQAQMRERKLAALDAALRETNALADIARPITFWAYMANRDIPGLTTEMQSRPLPEPRDVSPIPVATPVRSTSPRAPDVAPAAVARTAKSAPQSAVLPRTVPPIPAVETPPADLFQAELASPSIHASEPRPDEHPWLPKLRAVVGFAFAVAKADGRIAAAERATIRSFLGAKYGHDAALARHIDPLMEQTEVAVPDESTVVDQVSRITTASEQAELYALAEQVADASGRRNSREQAMLTRIATTFNISASDSRPQSQPPPAATPAPDNDPRAVLEIPADAELGVELVRRRYALLSDKLDPSKAASLGPEFRRLADDKRARLRAAAEALLAPFQAALDPPTAPMPPTDLRHNPDLDDVFGV